MIDLRTIERDTLSSEFFENINYNFQELSKETDYHNINTVDIEDKAVTNSKIANGAVTTNKIENLAVTKEKLAQGSVSNDKIQYNAIKIEKLEKDLQNKLGNTKRIFIVTSIPSTNTIIDINGVTTTAQVGDIVILVKGENGDINE